MSEELKPCPFCGGKSYIHAANGPYCGNFECALHHVVGFNVKSWNTRPAPVAAVPEGWTIHKHSDGYITVDAGDTAISVHYNGDAASRMLHRLASALLTAAPLAAMAEPACGCGELEYCNECSPPAAMAVPSDPCPQCAVGGVCKTPSCGRLKSSECMALYGMPAAMAGDAGKEGEQP